MSYGKNVRSAVIAMATQIRQQRTFIEETHARLLDARVRLERLNAISQALFSTDDPEQLDRIGEPVAEAAAQ